MVQDFFHQQYHSIHNITHSSHAPCSCFFGCLRWTSGSTGRKQKHSASEPNSQAAKCITSSFFKDISNLSSMFAAKNADVTWIILSSSLNNSMTQCLAQELPHRAKPNLLCQPQSHKHFSITKCDWESIVQLQWKSFMISWRMMYHCSTYLACHVDVLTVGFPTIISLAENQKTQTLPNLAAPTHHWAPQLL